MNSSFYDSLDDLDQSVSSLVQTYSLARLLKRDRDGLYLRVQSIAFYHPKTDREQAEHLLRSHYAEYRCNGLFLVRDCTTSPRDFSLSIISNDKFYHYKIQLVYDIYFSIDSGPQIAGIEQVIRYYQERPDGLVCGLSNEFLRGQPLPATVRCLGWTNTLHRACHQGNLEVVNDILSPAYAAARPDIDARDARGSTALHQASYFGHDDIVRALIKAGAQAVIRDAYGATALHRAAAANRASTLAILIREGGADYEERNYTNYWVPLHEAAFYNSAACVRLLLECGAPHRPRTDQGKTPLQLAEQAKSNETIVLLRGFQAPSARSDRRDWFHESSTFDRLAAKHLIESAANGPRNGMFIVRRSSKNGKNYALTLFHEREVFNFEILSLDERTFYIDDGPYFDTLGHLIDHYCRIPDGLPTILTCSVHPLGEVRPARLLSKGVLSPETPVPAEIKPVPKTRPSTSNVVQRPGLSSSLSSSITSLNSSLTSSRSRASSTQESALSTSSSDGSLSGHSPLKITLDDMPLLKRKPLADRRKTIGGPTKSYPSELSPERVKNDSPGKTNPLKLQLISSYQIVQTSKLGEGEFGEVYQGFYQENSKTVPVAIKHLKDYSFSSKQDFLREAEHMSKLSHPCICKLYGIVESSSNEMMMIIELLLLGSMGDYLWKYKAIIHEFRLKLWASQIAEGMAYMESKGIVHRDLAARNILLQSTDQVKISDFGLSRCIDTDIYVQKSDSKIPVKWYSPEAISVGRFTCKSDVWSFGITLWEMFSYGETPYGDRSGSDVYYALKHGQRLEQPKQCSLSIYQIMHKCWQWDESKRPSFEELLVDLKSDSQSAPSPRRKSFPSDPSNGHAAENFVQF